MRRRALLKQTSGLTTAVLLAGCSTFAESEESPSPGTLTVTNNHTIPHIITIRVLDGPDDRLGDPITLHSQVALEPNEEGTYPNWLKIGPTDIVAGEYTVEVQLDGQETKDFQFNPKPADENPNSVRIEVTDTGEFIWGVYAIQ